jgi:sulfite reductase beta subunit-like hemoprotein
LDRFAEDDQQFLKFHGIYQQDDRDLRKTGKKFIMMVRGRIPGGVMSPNQWQVFDDLAERHGNDTLRITTRQSIQFHGVVKSNLAAVVRGINESLLSTLAACGDVNRNVLAPPTPGLSPGARGSVRRLRGGGGRVASEDAGLSRDLDGGGSTRSQRRGAPGVSSIPSTVRPTFRASSKWRL